MTTTEIKELTIVDEADLWAQLKNRDLDVTLLTDYYRHKLWALWRQEVDVDGATANEAIETLASEADSMLEGCRRPFCPECGSTNLLELRDATAYLKIKSVYLGGSTSLMSDQDPDEAVSIMDSTDLVRCSDCNFESEFTDALVESARLGAPKHGSIVVAPFVHVVCCLVTSSELGARVHVYDRSTEAWGKIIGPDRDTIPLPIPADSEPDQIEQALQIVVGQVTDMRGTIVDGCDAIELEEDGYRLGELFEPLCWSITAEHAKQLQAK